MSLFAFSFYCVELPLSALIAFAIVAATYVIVRIELVYENRRPLNKSQRIIEFSQYCHSIYFLGSVINIYVNTFLNEYVERHYHVIIELAPQPINEEDIFMVKLFLTFVYLVLLTGLGLLARKLGLILSPKTLIGTFGGM